MGLCVMIALVPHIGLDFCSRKRHLQISLAINKRFEKHMSVNDASELSLNRIMDVEEFSTKPISMILVRAFLPATFTADMGSNKPEPDPNLFGGGEPLWPLNGH